MKIFKANKIMSLNDIKTNEKYLSGKLSEKCVIIPCELDVLGDKLEVITKDMFRISLKTIDIEEVNTLWDKLRGDYNFIMIDSSGNYFSVDYLNRRLGY